MVAEADAQMQAGRPAEAAEGYLAAFRSLSEGEREAFGSRFLALALAQAERSGDSALIEEIRQLIEPAPPARIATEVVSEGQPASSGPEREVLPSASRGASRLDAPPAPVVRPEAPSNLPDRRAESRRGDHALVGLGAASLVGGAAMVVTGFALSDGRRELEAVLASPSYQDHRDHERTREWLRDVERWQDARVRTKTALWAAGSVAVAVGVALGATGLIRIRAKRSRVAFGESGSLAVRF